MPDSPYRSLYRRYRPQRFSEVRGQEHVTRALRNAVRDGRIGHAYLFSGPRGTGKTSTARILAKVLNCASPQDGEPCGQCDNCRAVERGQVIDWLLEQDAASKSKVDDMRDLLDRVPLGTSGNRKVIILDEVHMLSQGAENALLKTLEEPPEHVVFVLATTDPQKVRPTIRSRAQHFEFHLLPPDVMEDHVRQVIHDAHLTLEDEDAAVAHVVRAGGGSARDTLSALDQVAALGTVMADHHPVDAILDALVSQDPGAALVGVADAMAVGRDPRALGETLMGRLRDAFLAVMGAADAHLPAPERARAGELGEQLGPSGLTRALEVLGEALTELSRKPDPRVVLEVALVRLTRPDADRGIDGVLARLERLEAAMGSGLPAATPAPAAGSPGGGPATAARAVLAGKQPKGQPTARPRPAAPPEASRPEADPSKASRPEADPSKGPSPKAQPPGPPKAQPPGRAKAKPPGNPDQASRATTSPAASPGGGPAAGALPGSVAALAEAWRAKILAELPPSVRSRWRGGSWVELLDAGLARFAVDNQWHQQACQEGCAEVERVVAEHFGARLRIEVVVEGRASTATPGAPAPGGDGADPEDLGADLGDIGDVAALPDAGDVATGGVDLLLREFGGELVEEDPR